MSAGHATIKGQMLISCILATSLRAAPNTLPTPIVRCAELAFTTLTHIDPHRPISAHIGPGRGRTPGGPGRTCGGAGQGHLALLIPSGNFSSPKVFFFACICSGGSAMTTLKMPRKRKSCPNGRRKCRCKACGGASFCIAGDVVKKKRLEVGSSGGFLLALNSTKVWRFCAIRTQVRLPNSGIVCIRASSERVRSVNKPSCPFGGFFKSERWTGASLPRDWLPMPPSQGSCAIVWGDKATSSMFAKHDESEATAQPMARMVHGARHGGRCGPKRTKKNEKFAKIFGKLPRVLPANENRISAQGSVQTQGS